MPAANNTSNTSAVIKAQVYSDFILKAIQDGLLPEGFHRDVSDFGDGETLFIPVIGETVIRDVTVENGPVQYDPIDSGQVSLTINQFKSGATSVSGKLKDDAYALAAIEAEIPGQHLRKIKEAYETDLLAQAQKQTLGAGNVINGFAHRWVAHNGTAQVISMEDFIYAKLALDKAGVPAEGRVAVVDAVVEATLNSLAGTKAFDNSPRWEGLLTEGFAKNNKFLWSILGFDLYVSDRLGRIASETINAGPSGNQSITGGVANVFMSVLDDQHKPFMGAWRRQPQTHGEYNKDKDQDEYVTYARWGFGKQRDDTLVTVITSATAF